MDNNQTKIDVEKIWDKIKLNSFYEAKSSDTFILYDESIAQKITEEGKKTIGQISDEIEELQDIKNRYEEKGDKISLERAAKTKDKIYALKKEFKDKL